MENQTDLRMGLFRSLAVVCCLLGAATMADGYTIVMRGGRLVQIPDQFTVTETSLSYQVAPTIAVTLAMAAIDVVATEQANNEAPGSLLKRVAAGSPAAIKRSRSEYVGKNAQARTITNKELESYARVRRASEAAYEKRRIELGLPSLAESRRRAAADAESLAQLAAETLAAEQQAEGYWRERAGELRVDLAATNAQIDFLRSRLGELNASPEIGQLAIGFSSFGGLNSNTLTNRRFARRPGVFVAPSTQARFGLAGQGRVLAPSIVRSPGSGRLARTGFRGSFGAFYGWQPGAYDYGYDAAALAVELDRLMTNRVALEARERELQEEARRAGVPPGWLRP